MPLKFKDWESAIKGRWFERDVEIAVKLGLLTGHDDGMFTPDAPVTRAQLAAVLRRQYELEGREPIQKALLRLVYISSRVGNVRATGSGFWLPGKPWRVMTNAHVVGTLEGAAESLVVYGNPAAGFSPIDGQKATILVLAHDYDLAVLEVEPPWYRIEPIQVTLADSDAVQGQTVWALGNPFGFPWDVSKGVVRHAERYLNYWKKSQRVYGLDVPINHGNSGGMLVDYLGRVLGVPSAGMKDADSFNFAVPLASILEVSRKCP